jgi:hypothetical protein
MNNIKSTIKIINFVYNKNNQFLFNIYTDQPK